MKRIFWIYIALLSIVLCSFRVSPVQSKTLYDDFSGTGIDPQKWKENEIVREVSNGKFLSKVGNSQETINARNNTAFRNPESIDVIECDLIVHMAVLDTGANSQSVARIDGRFYKSLNEGTEKGDIWAGVFIGDQGNGIEAWWEVWEATDDNGDIWEEKDSGTLSVPTLVYGQPYKVKIGYDGNNNFDFTVGGVSDSFAGPARQAAAKLAYKGLETVVYTDDGPGNGFVSASFDNVYINNQASPYDDFSNGSLDQTKWQSLEFVKETLNGKLRLGAHSTGSRQDARIGFTTIHPFTEATVRVKGNSSIDPGERGIARIGGYFYNDTYGPGSYNKYEGNIWSGIWINYFGDGTLKAACSADKILNAEDTLSENLFYREFNVPIILDRDYKLSIQFTGSNLRFIIKDTVTGRMDVLGYEVKTAVYEPYEKYIALRSRVYGDSTGGYMDIEFDDVNVDVAEPAATFNATGDWELNTSNLWADSGCDLPDVDSTDDVTISQSVNDITFVVHNEDEDTTLTGKVYGDTYAFLLREENNEETQVAYGIFTLSQSTSGSGNVTFIWTDGVQRCESGFDMALTKASADGTDGDGGGGGGGCYIDCLRY